MPKRMICPASIDHIKECEECDHRKEHDKISVCSLSIVCPECIEVFINKEEMKL